MKLNPKCIRDLLEVFEETVQDANTTYHFESMDPDGGFSFIDIMPEAHALLANMRIPKVFKILQSFIGVAGSASIEQMATIATTAMTSVLPGIINLAQETLRKTP